MQKHFNFLKKLQEKINKKKIFYKKNIIKEKNKLYINISNIQMISFGTSLIPFVEHNDANRALMGSNMQRQALPLINIETPILETGIEKVISHISESNIKINKSGITKYASSKKIIIHHNIFTKNKIIKNFEKKSYIFNKKIIKKYKTIKYNKYSKKIYFLKKNKNNNQNIYNFQKIKTRKNEWVKEGQIIAEGIDTQNNKLVIGKNLLVAYIPWKGYNFEDAIIINERIIKENILTSIHIKKYKTFLIKNEIGEVRIKVS